MGKIISPGMWSTFRLFALTAATAFMVLFDCASAGARQVLISIDKTSQNMTVSIDGQEEYVWPVSTGMRGYTTPSGTYRALRLEEFHFSEEWDYAPMPNSIFFTERGHAIHGTDAVDRLGRRASHGCVRLSPEDAATLYFLVEEVGMANTTVIVGGAEPKKVQRQSVHRLMRSPDWKRDTSDGY